MLTRKHFELIADKLKENKPKQNDFVPRIIQWEEDIEAICAALKSINPNFNTGKFKLACGVLE